MLQIQTKGLQETIMKIESQLFLILLDLLIEKMSLGQGVLFSEYTMDMEVPDVLTS